MNKPSFVHNPYSLCLDLSVSGIYIVLLQGNYSRGAINPVPSKKENLQ